MNMHKNARLTPLGRERIVRQVESGQTPEAVSETAGVCPRTVRKWVERYRREGLAGLQDRSSRPHRLRRPTPQTVIAEIERLRRQRWTGKQIAAQVGVSPATVSRVLRRLGLNKVGFGARRSSSRLRFFSCRCSQGMVLRLMPRSASTT
jgi:transposase